MLYVFFRKHTKPSRAHVPPYLPCSSVLVASIALFFHLVLHMAGRHD